MLITRGKDKTQKYNEESLTTDILTENGFNYHPVLIC